MEISHTCLYINIVSLQRTKFTEQQKGAMQLLITNGITNKRGDHDGRIASIAGEHNLTETQVKVNSIDYNIIRTVI